MLLSSNVPGKSWVPISNIFRGQAGCNGSGEGRQEETSLADPSPLPHPHVLIHGGDTENRRME